MSSLNSAATRALLMEPDVLSDSGKIQSIWELFTKNVNYQNKDNDLLRVILRSLEKNVLHHLSLSDKDVEACAVQFRKMAHDICKETDHNVLTVFLLVLSEALREYAPLRDETVNNIEINMNESEAEVSTLAEMKIFAAMERHGFLDQTELESLFDDRNLALMEASKEIACCLGKDSLPTKGGDVDESQPFMLEDFIPMWKEVKLRLLHLVVFKTDCFPDTFDNIMKMINPRSDLDSNRFYRPGAYLTNLANAKVYHATAHAIGHLCNVDSTTALYMLRSLYEKITQLKQAFGDATSIVYSEAMILFMTMRFLSADRGDEDPGVILNLDEVRDKLSCLINMIDDNRTTTWFKNEAQYVGNKDLVDEYVGLALCPDTGHGYVCNGNDCPDDWEMFSVDDVNAALDNLQSEVEDILDDLKQICDDDGVLESLGVSDVALSSPKSRVEQAASGKRSTPIASLLECGELLHKELNQHLLDGNLESAANSVAREIALETLMAEQILYVEPTGANRLLPIRECLKRDVTTYRELLATVPGGVEKYKESAQSYVADFIRVGMTTQS